MADPVLYRFQLGFLIRFPHYRLVLKRSVFCTRIMVSLNNKRTKAYTVLNFLGWKRVICLCIFTLSAVWKLPSSQAYLLIVVNFHMYCGLAKCDHILPAISSTECPDSDHTVRTYCYLPSFVFPFQVEMSRWLIFAFGRSP